MPKPKRRDALKGNPVLLDALRPELGADIVQAVQQDMARAAAARADAAPSTPALRAEARRGARRRRAKP